MPPRKRAKKAVELLTVTFPRFGTLTGTVLGEEDNDGEHLIIVRWSQPLDGGDKRWDWKVPAGESYLVKHPADSPAALSEIFEPPHPKSNEYNLLTEEPAGCRFLVPTIELDDETTYYLGERLDENRWWVTKKRLTDPAMIGDHGYAPYIPSYPAALYMLVCSQVQQAMHGESFGECTIVGQLAFEMNDRFVRHASGRPVNRQHDIACNELKAIEFAVAEVKRQLQTKGSPYDALWGMLLLFSDEGECAFEGVWEDDFSHFGEPHPPLVKACSGIALVTAAVLFDAKVIEEASSRLAKCPEAVLKLLPPLDRKFESAGAGVGTWKDKKACTAWRTLLAQAKAEA